MTLHTSEGSFASASTVPTVTVAICGQSLRWGEHQGCPGAGDCAQEDLASFVRSPSPPPRGCREAPRSVESTDASPVLVLLKTARLADQERRGTVLHDPMDAGDRAHHRAARRSHDDRPADGLGADHGSAEERPLIDVPRRSCFLHVPNLRGEVRAHPVCNLESSRTCRSMGHQVLLLAPSVDFGVAVDR